MSRSVVLRGVGWIHLRGRALECARCKAKRVVVPCAASALQFYVRGFQEDHRFCVATPEKEESCPTK